MAKRNNNRLLLIGLAVVVAGLLAAVYYKSTTRETGTKVQTETVSKRTIKEEVAASGKVFPQTEVKISSDVSGEIVELKVEEGDSIVQGQLLAKIDPDAFQSQVERGVAGVNSAKAQLANSRAQIENLKAQKAQIEVQLDNAREIFDRNKKLFEEGVISDADFETAEANFKGLQANIKSSEASIRAAEQSAKASEFQVKSSEASLKELRTSLRRTTIYAPVSGILSLLNVEQGERVVGTIQMAGTEMMRIANLNAMEVQVEVSENDIPRVSIGDEVDIEIDAYQDRIFKGKVFQIANTANNATTGGVSLTTDQVTNFVVTINMEPSSYADLITPQKPYPFRPGMSASVEINTQTLNDIIAVPIQAVTTREPDEEEKGDDDDILEVVFVISADADTVQMLEVKTGIQDNNYIRVVSGLSVGQEVVTGPYSAVSRKLKEGEEIRVVDEEELFAESEN
ncbi:MAG: efflux RND transporter periplasmic adaptor subunit [Saprospiraceae bacterium]